MHRSPLIVFILFAALCSAPALAGPREKIVVASVVGKDDGVMGRLLYETYAEALRRLNVELDYRSMPAARASAEIEAGSVDLEVGRSFEYGLLHPGLLRIDEAVATVTAHAYTVQPGIEISNWAALNNKDYKVEYRLGYAAMKQRIEAVVPPGRVSVIADGVMGLKKLAAGRTDIYVDMDEFVFSQLASDAFRGSGIRSAGVLERGELFPYLNRRRAHLAAPLAAVLKDMKASGALQKIRSDAFDAERQARNVNQN